MRPDKMWDCSSGGVLLSPEHCRPFSLVAEHRPQLLSHTWLLQQQCSRVTVATFAPACQNICPTLFLLTFIVWPWSAGSNVSFAGKKTPKNGDGPPGVGDLCLDSADTVLSERPCAVFCLLLCLLSHSWLKCLFFSRAEETPPPSFSLNIGNTWAVYRLHYVYRSGQLL